MRGTKAKRLRKMAHVMSTEYPELNKAGYSGTTYYTYGWRRIYRYLKRTNARS